jgi:hypothetical protein
LEQFSCTESNRHAGLDSSFARWHFSTFHANFDGSLDALFKCLIERTTWIVTRAMA